MGDLRATTTPTIRNSGPVGPQIKCVFDVNVRYITEVQRMTIFISPLWSKHITQLNVNNLTTILSVFLSVYDFTWASFSDLLQCFEYACL